MMDDVCVVVSIEQRRGACGGYVLDGLDMDWTISLLTLTLTPALLSRGYILDFAR